MKYFLLVSVVVGAICAAAAPASSALKSELEAIFDTDQEFRTQLQEVALKSGPLSEKALNLWKQQQKIDEKNIKRVEEIVQGQGWPDQRVVGEKAAMAAFLVVQHADSAHQKKYLPVLRKAVKDGKARPQDLALLEDRVLMTEGKRQLYGSQLCDNGKGGWEFCPIEDERNVDKRRKAVGLGPIAEYARQSGIEYSAR